MVSRVRLSLAVALVMMVPFAAAEERVSIEASGAARKQKKLNAGPLHMAVVNGRIAAVRALLAEGYAADAAYREGATPLHLAAAFGHGEIAALLLAHADNASLPDAKGHTPRDVSALVGHTDVEQLLLHVVGVDRAAYR